MAALRDNMDEEMMNIINTGTQFADGDQQDVDDGMVSDPPKIMRQSLGLGKLSPSLPAAPPFLVAASLTFSSFGSLACYRKRFRSS